MTREPIRPRRISVLLTALLTTGVLVVAPAQAEPDIDDVRETVDRLYHEAEQAQERHHDAALRLEELSAELGAMKADERRQGRRLSVVREQVQDTIIRQYQGEGISTVGQVVVSDDPGSFLGQLSTMSAFGDYQQDLFAEFATEAEALDVRQEATAERQAEIRATTAALAEEKQRVEAKLDQAQETLDELEEEERARLLASTASNVEAPTDIPASGRAGAAVRAAMAQVGKAYVYGAAGPSAYDCSGLTMMAWGQAGVGLPHSSSAQFGSGPHVAQSDLQPGDLVFYYSPISHVGMYIGNGLIVHAANPSSGVRVAGLHSMPYVGAVRPG